MLQKRKLEKFGSTLIRSAIVADQAFDPFKLSFGSGSDEEAETNLMMEHRKRHRFEFNR